MRKIPNTIIHRFLETVPKFQEILQDALTKQTKEPGTLQIVADMLEDVLGYDKFNDLIFDLVDPEGKRDLVVRLNERYLFPVEVVAVDSELQEAHLREAKIFALQKEIPWLMFTNGIQWQVYRVDPEAAHSITPVLQFNFLELNEKDRQHQYWLYLLSREGFQKNALDRFYEHAQIVNPYSISVLLQSDWVAARIARELKKLNPNLHVEKTEIAEMITREVLREEVTHGKAFNKAKFTIQQLYKQLGE